MIPKTVTLRRWRRSRRLERCQPDWSPFLEAEGAAWKEALSQASAPKVLIATSVGAHMPGTILESLLGVCLTLRGASVHFLLCDGVLPACLDCVRGATLGERELAVHGPQRHLCALCFSTAEARLDPLGLQVHRYGGQLAEPDRCWADELASSIPTGEIPGFRLEGMAIGEHALAGALRFYARGTLEGGARQERILRRYFQAALLTARVLKKLQEREGFGVALFHHGIYIPQGVAGEFFRSRGIRVVTWNPAYRKKCFIFSHGDTYHHTLMNEPTAGWEKIPWSDGLERRTMEYLESRWQGTQDWIWFHERPREELGFISRRTGVDFSKPCIGLLTNVFWDAQLHYPANAFANMLEWLQQTIGYFSRRPGLQLLVRIHPAEVRGSIPSRQPIAAELRRAFPRLPANVFVIPPQSRISTYAAMMPCDAVIIYGTKTGVELASLGIPVIVAGEAWIRGKGVTRDARSREEYFRILDELPFGMRMGEAQKARARRYAFHFFFRRMIPVDPIVQRPGWPPYGISARSIADLREGASLGLDVICRGILEGSEFVYPSELETGEKEGARGSIASGQ